MASGSRQIKVQRTNRHRYQVSIDELTLMLQIDLALGRKDDFRRRLQRALDSAYTQGQTHG